MSRSMKFFLVVLSLLCSKVCLAIDVSEVVGKANYASYYQGEGGKAKVSMAIFDRSKNKRSREFVILRKDVNSQGDKTGDQNFFVYFSRPADVNKTVFMVHKKVGDEDNRWLYLPALDLVRRIAAGDKRTSFVGSNFFYEDVSGRNPDEDTHILSEESSTYFIVESKPKNPKTVEFSSYKNWIHRKTFIPVKTEFYDKKGEAYRVYEALKVKTIQDFPTVTKSRMKDLKTGGYTEMEYQNVEYSDKIPADIFTERYLRNPPRKFIR